MALSDILSNKDNYNSLTKGKNMKNNIKNGLAICTSCILAISLVSCSSSSTSTINNTASDTITNKIMNYKLVDTNQVKFFNNEKEINQANANSNFYGQDAQYIKNKPSYTNNGDGTITDNVTGLMWQKSDEVYTRDEALEALKTFNLANHTDWRLPTIKELYSLMDFSGVDISGSPTSGVEPNGESTMMPPPPNMQRNESSSSSNLDISNAFIDTNYFDFKYGSNGNRDVDTQLLSSTVYKGKTLNGDDTVFGLNIADGRIKGYPFKEMGSPKKYTVRFVRGSIDYGKNNFQDNKNETISDLSTGLMWTKNDSKKGLNWENALKFAQEKNKENYLGYNDWRLPDAKELQSIVDYSKSLQATNSAAINEIFNISSIKNEGGDTDYPFFWTSTTHKNTANAKFGVYICFGEALGYYSAPNSSDDKKLVDVHGAGAQRSDPKKDDGTDYSQGHGPQGDVVRINNYVRLVRDIK